MRDCPGVGGRKYDVECGVVRLGLVGSDGVRFGPIGSDGVISHTVTRSLPVRCTCLKVKLSSLSIDQHFELATRIVYGSELHK